MAGTWNTLRIDFEADPDFNWGIAPELMPDVRNVLGLERRGGQAGRLSIKEMQQLLVLTGAVELDHRMLNEAIREMLRRGIPMESDPQIKALLDRYFRLRDFPIGTSSQENSGTSFEDRRDRFSANFGFMPGEDRGTFGLEMFEIGKRFIRVRNFAELGPELAVQATYFIGGEKDVQLSLSRPDEDLVFRVAEDPAKSLRFSAGLARELLGKFSAWYFLLAMESGDFQHDSSTAYRYQDVRGWEPLRDLSNSYLSAVQGEVRLNARRAKISLGLSAYPFKVTVLGVFFSRDFNVRIVNGNATRQGTAISGQERYEFDSEDFFLRSAAVAALGAKADFFRYFVIRGDLAMATITLADGIGRLFHRLAKIPADLVVSTGTLGLDMGTDRSTDDNGIRVMVTGSREEAVGKSLEDIFAKELGSVLALSGYRIIVGQDRIGPVLMESFTQALEDIRLEPNTRTEVFLEELTDFPERQSASVRVTMSPDWHEDVIKACSVLVIIGESKEGRSLMERALASGTKVFSLSAKGGEAKPLYVFGQPFAPSPGRVFERTFDSQEQAKDMAGTVVNELNRLFL